MTERAESDYLTSAEQKRLACVCGCPFTTHTEYGCKPHGFHQFGRTYRPAPVNGRRQAWRCGGCHFTVARCKCLAIAREQAALAETPE